MQAERFLHSAMLHDMGDGASYQLHSAAAFNVTIPTVTKLWK